MIPLLHSDCHFLLINNKKRGLQRFLEVAKKEIAGDPVNQRLVTKTAYIMTFGDIQWAGDI